MSFPTGADSIWRDNSTPGDSGSGQHDPVKAQIRAWGRAAEALRFDTVADAEAALIPSEVTLIHVAGAVTAGDLGHAVYVAVGSEPSHGGKLQAAGGRWWELAQQDLCPWMFRRASGVTTDQLAWEAMADCIEAVSWNASAFGRTTSVVIDGRGATYTLTGDIQIDSGGTMRNLRTKQQACEILLGAKADSGGVIHSWRLERSCTFQFDGAVATSKPLVVCELGFGWVVDALFAAGVGAPSAGYGLWCGRSRGSSEGKFWGYAFTGGRAFGGSLAALRIGEVDDHTGGSITGMTIDQGGYANLVLCNPAGVSVRGCNVENPQGRHNIVITSGTNNGTINSPDRARGVTLENLYMNDLTRTWHQDNRQISVGYAHAALGISSSAADAYGIVVRACSGESRRARFWADIKADGAIEIDDCQFGAVVAVDYDGGTGAFGAGGTVTGGTSGTQATIVEVEGGTVNGRLYLTQVIGVFQDGETLTGGGAGAAVADAPFAGRSLLARFAGSCRNVRLGENRNTATGSVWPYFTSTATYRIRANVDAATHTPVLRAGGADAVATYDSRSQTWEVRDGMLHLSGWVDWSAASAATGDLAITLPEAFTGSLAPPSGVRAAVAIATQNLGAAAEAIAFGGVEEIRLYDQNGTRATDADVNASGYIHWSASWPVDLGV